MEEREKTSFDFPKHFAAMLFLQVSLSIENLRSSHPKHRNPKMDGFQKPESPIPRGAIFRWNHVKLWEGSVKVMKNP